jgi:hypothetical protein
MTHGHYTHHHSILSHALFHDIAFTYDVAALRLDDTLGLHASVTHLPSLQVPHSTRISQPRCSALEPCGFSRVEDLAKAFDDDDGLPGRLVDTSNGQDYDTGSTIALEMQNPSPTS